MTDFIGLAALITSTGTFIGTMVGLYRGGRRDKKLSTIQATVDGLGDKRVTMAMRAGTAEGHAQGVADERADPQTPTGT